MYLSCCFVQDNNMKQFREYLEEGQIFSNKIKAAIAAIIMALGITTSSIIAGHLSEKAVMNNKNLTTVERGIAPDVEDQIIETIKNLSEVKEKEIPPAEIKQAVKKIVPKFIDVPQHFAQAGYSVTGYSDKGIAFARKNQMKHFQPWSEGTKQKEFHKKWIEHGKKYTNGIATINMDGIKRFLIAVTDTYGKVGDRVDFKLADGDVIKCVIADVKSRSDSNWDKWGHVYLTNKGGKQTNIIEFEVDPAVYNEKQENPMTHSWGLPWNDKVDGKRNNIVAYSNIDRDGYDEITEDWLDEMVTSADCGVNLVPERMPVKEMKVEKLCDFRKKKKRRWHFSKKVL